MPSALRRVALCLIPVLLSGCAIEGALPPRSAYTLVPEEAPELAGPASMNSMIGRYAAEYHVPESLIRRIIVRESGYNPRARNGSFMGLMQIRYDTARSMGYEGPPAGLLEAETNLRYGAKYLAGAYRVAHGNAERAIHLYASGYYYDAKRQGLLAEVGFKHGK